MKVGNTHYKTLWMDGSVVYMIDQTLLPFQFKIVACKTSDETCKAIKNMTVRGAGAIGAAAGFAMAQALMEGLDPEKARERIRATRPTAGDLFYAVDKVFEARKLSLDSAIAEAQGLALANEEAAKKIGINGAHLIKENTHVLTHCNAGWLGFVDYGSALSPIYEAHRQGRKALVYTDETRPRSQGARLTAWELYNEGIEHVIVPDNAGAYLMSKGLVDLIIVGADRIASNGDAANKIGTLEKAIVAKHFGIPFYIAAPLSTFDLSAETGQDIEIEERSPDEVNYQTGPDTNGQMHTIRVSNPGSDAFNPAFDVTPAEFITGIITEKGIIRANDSEIGKLF
ncbi:MAG: S-methyl-5-thioribose-1-phosphate isomerase [Lentimicrobium sp.]|jgi:S-methyl-5-thioribose-1-phosphate isomerase|nr:S-methyl-5-thioribose-1-phosphate isomerase [Lentimicrobium sp.]